MIRGALHGRARLWPLLASAAIAAPAWFGLSSCKDTTVVPISEGGAGGGGALGGSGGTGGSATSSGGTGGHGGHKIPADYLAACDAYATAWCSALYACTGQAASYFFGTEEDCVQLMDEGCNSIYRPGSRAADMAACAAAVPTPTGFSPECRTIERMLWVWESTPPAITNPEWPAECFFAGSLPDGSTCELSTECQSGFCNYPGTEEYCGICTQPMALNDPCTWNCGRGLYCIDGHCVPERDVGESCNGQQERCHVELLCIDGICELTPGWGEPCNSPPWGCWPHASASCALTQGGGGGGQAGAGGGPAYTCQWSSAGRAIAEPCGEMTDGPLAWCAFPGICRAEPGTSAGVCVPPKTEGELCSEGQEFLFYWEDCGQDLGCQPTEPDAGVGGGATGTCEPYVEEHCP